MRESTWSKRAGVLAAAAMLMSTSAYATLSLNDPGVVGSIRSGEPASIDDEVAYANNLLAMGANATASIDGHNYATSSTDYNATLSSVGASQNTTSTSGSGFAYVLAKYDGPNGGDILWYVGGGSFNLPADSSPLWTNRAGEGYGLSHWTGFGGAPPVPEPTTIIASALLLLPFGVSTIRALRRNKT